MISPFVSEATAWCASRQPTFYINTVEEGRILRALQEVSWLLIPKDRLYQLRDNLYLPQSLKANLNTAAIDADTSCTTIIDSPATATLADYVQAERFLRNSGQEPCAALIAALLSQLSYPVLVYDPVSGLHPDGLCAGEPLKFLSGIYDGSITIPDECLLVFLLMHEHLNTQDHPNYRRALLNLYHSHLLTGSVNEGGNVRQFSRFLFFVQPYTSPHPDIQNALLKLSFATPDATQIEQQLDDVKRRITVSDPKKSELTAPVRHGLTQAMLGLDEITIERYLFRGIRDHRGFEPSLVDQVRRFRAQHLSEIGGIRIYDPADPEISSLGAIAGYENVLDLVEDYRLCSTPDANRAGLRLPGGMAVQGPPGTGKSMTAKLVARWLGLPLIVFNLGRAKRQYLGETEATVDRILQIIKRMGLCVVLFDEWDKQAGGVVSSAGAQSTDGGTTSGALSMILDYAAEPTRRSFLIFTMNRLHGPVESLRAGRIESFFCVPLPDAVLRQEILALKLKEKGVKLTERLESCLVEVAHDNTTATFSGSELEAIIEKACRSAFRARKVLEPTLQELLTARQLVTPVTSLDPQEIAAMVSFAGKVTSVNKERKHAGKAFTFTPPTRARRQMTLDEEDN